MKSKVTLLNVISSLILQILTIISTFIIPKIILSYFGSSVNGLVSSVNQFLNYITLVEGGITGVISANLYLPLVNHETEKISSIVVTAKRFFGKIGLLFVLYSLILAFAYPFFFDTGLDYIYVASLIIILAIGLAIQYLFSLAIRTLLIADKKLYIVNLVQMLIVSLSIILSILSVHVFPSIHLLKLLCGIVYMLQPVVFGYFIKKYYVIDWKAPVNNNLIKQRWNGFAINIAAFIHNCTDVSLLTAFSSLEIVSVYSVHALISNGLKQIISAITSGINPILGHAYAKGDHDELNLKLDVYEYVNFVLVFFAFTLAELQISPFVTIYTKGIGDAEYYQPVFAKLILLAEALSLIKNPHLNLAYAANKFRQMTIPAYIEAGLNILISLCLVHKYQLIGVSIGTCIAMAFRMIYQVYFTSKIVEDRSQFKFYFRLISFTCSSLIGIAICSLFAINESTIVGWIINSIIYSFILLIGFLLLSIAFYRKELRFILTYMKRVNGPLVD